MRHMKVSYMQLLNSYGMGLDQCFAAMVMNFHWTKKLYQIDAMFTRSVTA